MRGVIDSTLSEAKGGTGQESGGNGMGKALRLESEESGIVKDGRHVYL